MRTLVPYTRAAFALTAIKCGHLLVMAEDTGLMPVEVPKHLKPDTDAITKVMRAAMKIACGH